MSNKSYQINFEQLEITALPAQIDQQLEVERFNCL